jgi:hypothetical protein
MSTEENDNGWDSLAEDLGLQRTEPAPKPEKPAPSTPSRSAPRSAQVQSHRDPRPEVEQDAEDFGSGVTADPTPRPALYDPGPGALMEDADDLIAEEAAEPIDDGAEGDEPHEPVDEGLPQEEGGKRRRRRRRRRKKGGSADEAAPGGETTGGETTGGETIGEATEDDEASGVEEGEAPAPFEGDDDEEAPHSAMDEEMEAEAAQPRPEWHVMTWNELVSKLHRPN